MPERFTVNSIVGLSNVLFFMVVQVLFFWFIASREIDRIMIHKSSVLMMLRDKLRQEKFSDTAEALDAVVIKKRREKAKEAEKNAEARKEKNLALVYRWMVPCIIAVSLVLLALVMYNRRNNYGLEHAHKVGLGLVVCAYVCEVLFFLTVVENYIMISDTDILREVTGLKGTQVQLH